MVSLDELKSVTQQVDESENLTFSGKRVLLLQGPVGPFFWTLAKDLRAQGACVFKFNFNAGDWLFYQHEAHRFRGNLQDWPEVLKRFILEKKIDAVLLFGDCRPVHAMVRAMGQEVGFVVGVFEEGYLRPDHVTFEPFGVNGHSKFPQELKRWIRTGRIKERVPESLAGAAQEGSPKFCGEITSTVSQHKVGNTYWHAACWGMLYFFAAWLGQWFWNNQLHHRKLSIMDAPWWWLSFGRKQWYRWSERGVQAKLTGSLRNQFFLVPLQVHNDAQITVHSDYESVCRFIDVVMRSFAAAVQRVVPSNDPSASLHGCQLVFKHHPMDRGHRNYAAAIRRLTARHRLQGRVMYIHDQHLPSLLKACRGVVVVNSTTGLSALGHDAAVKVCGTALYDLPGLTYQGPLSSFWNEALNAKPDAEMLMRFKHALLARTQLNGSFYRKLEDAPWVCGVMLEKHLETRLWQARSQASCEVEEKPSVVNSAAVNCEENAELEQV